MNYLSTAPIENITGIEVVLRDTLSEQPTSKIWVLRIPVTNPSSPLALPSLPPSLVEKAPLAWKHAQVAFIRNETNGDSSVFRSVRTHLAPQTSDRLTARLRFPLGTKLRITALEADL